MSKRHPDRPPSALDPATADMHELAENARRRAWFRMGVHDTVEKLRKDKGFQKAVAEHAINMVVEKRGRLFQAAMNAAIRERPIFERNLREGKGIWFDELLPLTPKERGHVLKKLKELWDIREAEPRKALQ